MSPDSPPILRLRGVTFGYQAETVFLGPVNLSAHAGQIHAIIGPNGAGKSTLLRLAIGLLPPRVGEVHLDDRPWPETPPRERARRIAFLSQTPSAPPAVSAEEIVRLGRHPHRGWSPFETPADLDAVRDAMTRTETLALIDRDIATLSGGEAQRVHLAAALAQHPRLLALDEPTGGLDLYHQLRIFDLLHTLAHDDGLAVLVVTHELNLAARYADVITLLHEGRTVAQGPPIDVLRSDVLSDVYRVQFVALDPATGPPWLCATAVTPDAGGHEP